MKQQSLLKWFRSLIQWVRRIFNVKDTARQPLIILERIYSTDEDKVLLSVERDAPGSVATWYLIHRYNPKHNLLITLDNLAAVRLGLRKGKPKNSKLSILELSLAQDDAVVRTHRFSVQWIIQLHNSRKIFSLIGTWDADLQGDSFDPNAKAITIFRLMMREALNLPSIPGLPWRLRMINYPWSESVQHYAQAVLGDYHNCHIKKLNFKSMKANRIVTPNS